MAGFFVTFEGVDGCGKTAQAALLATALRRTGRLVVETREPGGSPFGERLRPALLAGLDGGAAPETLALLFAALRCEHVRRVIAPALERGAVVVCDRYADSTWAYQGASGAAASFLSRLEETTGFPVPDVTFLLDVSPETALRRRLRRGESVSEPAATEAAAVRRAFLELAARSPERFAVIDGEVSLGAVHERIMEVIETRLAGVGSASPDVVNGCWSANDSAASPAGVRRDWVAASAGSEWEWRPSERGL